MGNRQATDPFSAHDDEPKLVGEKAATSSGETTTKAKPEAPAKASPKASSRKRS